MEFLFIYFNIVSCIINWHSKSKYDIIEAISNIKNLILVVSLCYLFIPKEQNIHTMSQREFLRFKHYNIFGSQSLFILMNKK